MASNDSSESKPFGMSNLFFGNPESLKLPKLPPPERGESRLLLPTKTRSEITAV